MSPGFWKRPIPRWLRLAVLWSSVAALLALASAVGVWVHAHRAYDRWLNSRPDRLVSHEHLVIAEGEVQGMASEEPLDLAIDQHLLRWRTDRENVAELSRSDPLVFRVLGRAHVRVLLHTRAPDTGVEARIEFVSEFARDGGDWVWRADHNLALE